MFALQMAAVLVQSLRSTLTWLHKKPIAQEDKLEHK